MYSVKDLDEDKNILWLADDLLMTAREVVPDIKYEDIRYTNDLMYDESNKPIYLMTNKDSIILGRWKPDYINYRKKKKDLEPCKSCKFFSHGCLFYCHLHVYDKSYNWNCGILGKKALSGFYDSYV